MNILLTGATGFLGQRLASQIDILSGIYLTSAVRSYSPRVQGEIIFFDCINGLTDWRLALKNKDVIIHAAARVHVMQSKMSSSVNEYREVNVNLTLNLARQAAKAGVRRFVFISSIKVNGENTLLGRPFRAEDFPAPEDDYAISKYEAEQGLLQIAADTGLEVVIIRAPLVYGPGVKGNFGMLIQAVKKRFPLPLGAISNKRSFIALDNLIDLIITCSNHPAAANQVFLAGDGQDLSTTELVKCVAKSAGVPCCLIPVPCSVLTFAAGLLRRKEIAQRLVGSLQVDISKCRQLLDWRPPLSVEDGLKLCFIDQPEV